MPDVDPAIAECYLKRYWDAFGHDFLKGQRIAIYEHSSVSRDVLNVLFSGMGAEIISLGRTDQFVPIDTEAVRPEDILQAREWAKSYDFDMLVSTDGDGDRPLISDEKGNWLRGDMVGILCAQFLQANIVVTPVSSNSALEKSALFSSTIRTRIGSPYVIDAMQTAMQASEADSVVVGYEANGGFLLASDICHDQFVLQSLPTRDAVLPILSLLALAKQQKKPVSELQEYLPHRYTASDRIQNIAQEHSKTIFASLLTNLDSTAELLAPDAGLIIKLDQTDGFRFYFTSEDIVHLRASGNAPELRCYTESDTQERAELLCSRALSRLSLF